jgi:hypothetical protein
MRTSEILMIFGSLGDSRLSLSRFVGIGMLFYFAFLTPPRLWVLREQPNYGSIIGAQAAHASACFSHSQWATSSVALRAVCFLFSAPHAVWRLGDWMP